MLRRTFALLGAFIILSSLAGCFGQSKGSGKFSNQDKPKPPAAQQ